MSTLAADEKLMFYTRDGSNGAPLNCDCYSGCWTVHSVDWPALVFASEEHANEAYRLCHQRLDGKERKTRPPYGSYVLMGYVLRFATRALMNEHVIRLAKARGISIVRSAE